MTPAAFMTRVMWPLLVALCVLGIVVGGYEWSQGDVWSWRAVVTCVGYLCVYLGYRPFTGRPRYALVFLGLALAGTSVVGTIVKIRNHGQLRANSVSFVAAPSSSAKLSAPGNRPVRATK